MREVARLVIASSLVALVATPLPFDAIEAQRATQAGGASSAAGPIYATKPFSLEESDSLPKSYAGMDCVKIVARLKQLPLAKSQFETSAAYEQRILAMATGPLYGSIKMNDMLAFKVRAEIEPSYDADHGLLSIDWPDVWLWRDPTWKSRWMTSRPSSMRRWS